MNILKNFEAVFVGATAIAIASAALLAPNSDATASDAEPKVTHQVSLKAAPAHVVVVSAKRLTPEQKLQSLREEGQLAAARQQVARG